MTFMGKFIEFDDEFSTGYARDHVPSHAQDSLENYLVFGYHPGGFMEAMLAGDLFRAANCADSANGPGMQGIARWISQNAPQKSWGSYDAVNDWCSDKDEKRTAYRTRLEKERIMEILKA